MKNFKSVLSSAALILLLAMTGCKGTDTTGILRIHKYINQSGVEVAMVGDAYGDIPDSLVISNGTTYECSLRFPSMMEEDYSLMFPYMIEDTESSDILLKVYFNKDVCVGYTYNDGGRNPLGIKMGEYDIEVKRTEDLITAIYTYIFTPEDYQNAIKAQK